MKNRLRLALLFMCFLPLAALLILAACVRLKDFQDLNIIMPDGSGMPVYDLREVNKISDEEFLVTYDIKKRVTAEAVSVTHPVTLVGTNSSYREVMGLQMISGSFWSDEAWNTGSRYMVLNESLAFRLFGGGDIIGNWVKLGGEAFIVTGVVQGGNKKEPVAFIPSSVLNERPEVLMAKTEEGSGAVLSGLRRLGLYESNCRVIDVSAVAQIFWQLFRVSLCFIIGVSVTMFSCKNMAELKIRFNVLKQRYQTMYPDELFMQSRKELKQISVLGLMIALEITFILLLARQILQTALGWMEIWDDIKYLSDYFFQGKMQWLMRFLVSGPLLFIVFMVALFLILALIFYERRSRGRTY